MLVGTFLQYKYCISTLYCPVYLAVLECLFFGVLNPQKRPYKYRSNKPKNFSREKAPC